jgi:hypothetical protein
VKGLGKGGSGTGSGTGTGTGKPGTGGATGTQESKFKRKVSDYLAGLKEAVNKVTDAKSLTSF